MQVREIGVGVAVVSKAWSDYLLSNSNIYIVEVLTGTVVIKAMVSVYSNFTYEEVLNARSAYSQERLGYLKNSVYVIKPTLVAQL